VHLSIDMQNIFSAGGIWHNPRMDRIVPGIARLVTRHAACTVFTRLILPFSVEDRPSRWQRYFARWDCATQPRLPPGALEIVSPLARSIPHALELWREGP
jgi:nicotinamidase-related amidase